MEGAASVLHELLLIVSVYAAMRALELAMSAESRYHSPNHAGVVRVVSLLCLLLFAFYAFLGVYKVFG